MKIAIHGTKDGYRILYTTDQTFARVVARDIRKGAVGDAQLGSTAYALSFIEGTCAFTKYIIVKDSIRDFSTGTIAFSVCVERDEEIASSDIYNLLNELYSVYNEKYIKNHYLNLGQRELVREDWSFVDQILLKYKLNRLTYRREIVTSGSLEAAVVYYENEAELQNYLAKPYQPDYSEYIQMLFINKNLKGEEDPINVLRNSGKILDIDLSNESYQVKNYDPRKSVKITINDKQLLGSSNNCIIWTKDKIKIYYSKDDDCYKPIDVTGYLFDTNIKTYLLTQNGGIIIQYDAFENIEPKTVTVKVKVNNYPEAASGNLEYKLADEQWSLVSSDTITREFRGYEIKKRTSIYFRAVDYVGEGTFTPLDSRNVLIVLKRRKVIDFEILNERQQKIEKYEIRLNSFNDIRKIDANRIEVYDKSIDSECQLSIVAEGYETKHVGIIAKNHPGREKVILGKKIQKRYFVDAREWGVASAEFSFSDSGEDVKVKVKNRLYRFEGWRLDITKFKNGYEGVLVAYYSKRKIITWKNIMIFILSLSLTVGVYFLTAWIQKDNAKIVDNTDSSNSTGETTVNASTQTKNQMDSSNALVNDSNSNNSIGRKSAMSESSDPVIPGQDSASETQNQPVNQKISPKRQIKPLIIEDINLLKSDTITKDKLKEWLNIGKEKNSVNIYLEFWDSISNDNKNYWKKILDKVKQDGNLKKSELKTYLEQNCTGDKLNKFINKPGKKSAQSIKELREK